MALLWTLLSLGTAISLVLADVTPSLRVKPDKYLPGVSRSVTVTCQPPENRYLTEIVMLQIDKMNGDFRVPIATYVMNSSPKSENTLNYLQRTALGSHDVARPEKSFLSAVISSPDETAQGTYICIADIIDNEGLFQRVEISGYLQSLDSYMPAFYRTLLLELTADIDILINNFATVNNSQNTVNTSSNVLRNNLTSLDALSKAAQSAIADINLSIHNSQQQEEFLSQRLDRLRDVTPATKVHFYAYFAGSTINLVNDAAMPFNALEEQTNNSYSTTTGIFAAPVNGTYFFRTGITAYYTYQSYFSILARNETVASLYIYDDYTTKQSTASAVVKLTAGDQVKVVNKSGFTTTIYGVPVTGYNFRSTYFMGYLLW